MAGRLLRGFRLAGERFTGPERAVALVPEDQNVVSAPQSEGAPDVSREGRHVTSAERLLNVLGADNVLVAVDVGGAHGLQPHWHKLVGACHFVVYEPHAEAHEMLKQEQAQDPQLRDFRYINEALASVAGTRTLYVTNVPTGSSLLQPKKGGFGDYPGNTYFWPFVTKAIETTTLSASLERQGIKCVDLIKLDTQGTELEILEGLDEARFASVLAVETEIAVLDFYDGTATALEDMMRFMRLKGFTLFDLRTNRHAGNAVRLDPAELAAVLGPGIDLPPNAHRLAELDAVFMRDPRLLISSGADAAMIRRLVAILIVYYFFPEAVYTVALAREKQLLSVKDADDILALIRILNADFSGETAPVAAFVRNCGGRAWGQYMWVPYPSA